MTEEQILKDALDYIAHCLERDEVYLPQSDRFARGDEAHKLLSAFARKRAKGDNEQWRLWCELKARHPQKQANANTPATRA